MMSPLDSPRCDSRSHPSNSSVIKPRRFGRNFRFSWISGSGLDALVRNVCMCDPTACVLWMLRVQVLSDRFAYVRVLGPVLLEIAVLAQLRGEVFEDLPRLFVRPGGLPVAA